MTGQQDSGEEPGRQGGGTQGEETMGGGRASRGPGVAPGGEKEMAGPTPMEPGPYEGRKQSADDLDSPSAPGAEGVDPGPGATKPQRVDDPGLISEKPEDTPRGRVASPADEQPASDFTDNTEEAVDPTGPTHYAGTSRGEDYPEKGTDQPERGREDVSPESGREKLR